MESKLGFFAILNPGPTGKVVWKLDPKNFLEIPINPKAVFLGKVEYRAKGFFGGG